jgi:hypothetical protein
MQEIDCEQLTFFLTSCNCFLEHHCTVKQAFKISDDNGNDEYNVIVLERNDT